MPENGVILSVLEEEKDKSIKEDGANSQIDTLEEGKQATGQQNVENQSSEVDTSSGSEVEDLSNNQEVIEDDNEYITQIDKLLKFPQEGQTLSKNEQKSNGKVIAQQIIDNSELSLNEKLNLLQQYSQKLSDNVVLTYDAFDKMYVDINNNSQDLDSKIDNFINFYDSYTAMVRKKSDGSADIPNKIHKNFIGSIMQNFLLSANLSSEQILELDSRLHFVEFVQKYYSFQDESSLLSQIFKTVYYPHIEEDKDIEATPRDENFEKKSEIEKYKTILEEIENGKYGDDVQQARVDLLSIASPYIYARTNILTSDFRSENYFGLYNFSPKEQEKYLPMVFDLLNGKMPQ